MATESFFSSASLAYLASAGAGKDGKTYSIKPTDGTGDFTFSRGSNLAATRVGADGLIEKGRENLLIQSNAFTTTWTLGAGLSLTSGQSGYDGSSDAWLYADTATGNSLGQSRSTSGVQTLSIYAKAGTANGIRLRWLGGSGGNSYFNIADSSTEAYNTTNTIQTKKESIGNGWYRISIVFNSAVNTIRLYVADGSTTSSVSGNIYIQDAQLEIGLAATDVIESGATTGKAGLLEDEPRFDYSGGATCPSLLLEPSRTNLVEYSEYFGDYNNNGITITQNAATSPEGLQNAAFLEETTGNTLRVRTNDIAFTLNNTFVYSVFVKSSGNFSLTHEQLPKFSVSFDFTGTPSFSGSGDWFDDAEIISYENDWYRCVIYVTPDLDFTSGVDIRLNNDNGYFYGLQVEQGSYPTSYIPNHSGGSVTRGKDTATQGDITSIVNSPEGTIFSEFAKVNDFDAFQLDDGSLSNRITLYPRGGTAAITFILTIGGVQVIRQDPSPSGLDTTEFNKYAIAWGLNDFRVYVNGVKIYTSTSNITFGSGAIDDLDLNGANHKQLLIFQEALSDADCITLTT